MEFSQSLLQELSPLLALASFFVGLAKAGITVFGALITPILLAPFPDPRQAVALGVSIFILGDILAVCYYIRSAKLSIIPKLFSVSGIGMAAATIAGKYIPPGPYMLCIALLSSCAFVLLVQSERHKWLLWLAAERGETVKHNSSPIRLSPRARQVLLMCSGMIAGFTTVLGNISGIFMVLYFSTLNLDKKSFVATTAVTYLIGNAVKILIYVFYWHSLDIAVLKIVPLHPWVLGGLFLGLLVGMFTIHKLTEKIFSILLLGTSFIALLIIIWRTIQIFLAN